MSSFISPADLGAALQEQLTLYRESVIEDVNAAGERAAKNLVKLTKASAPRDSGDYAKSLTYKAKVNPATGDVEYTWGARAPHHRITHLLVHGHATVNGGRVPGDPFLEDSMETVLPEYEKDVEEALKNVK